MKRLQTMIQGIETVSHQGDLNAEVNGITLDTRKLNPGDCFVAVKGFNRDGIVFLPDAINKGARSVISQNPPDLSQKQITWVQVVNDRRALSRMSATFYDNPSRRMDIIGVTGTNGKSTVVSLIQQLFAPAEKTVKSGTLGMELGGKIFESSLTTPEAPDLFSFLTKAERLKYKNLVMEVSSVGLALNRVDDVEFNQAVFTNLSGDHLDFHRTMDEYLGAKLRLFERLDKESWAIINLDDPCAPRFVESTGANLMTFGFSPLADVRPLDYHLSLTGIRSSIATPTGTFECHSPLIGRVNLNNILAAVAVAISKKIPLDSISDSLAASRPVRGRLDLIKNRDVYYMVDYAHTDQALEALLISLKELVPGRIILVFGAGGGRDTSKRPRMGAVASSHADYVIVTSDNPRSEDPDLIIKDILRGFKPDYRSFQVEVSREKAIEAAVDLAREKDMVVIAGKGHENYQIFRDRTIHFDDFEWLEKYLEIKHA